MICPYMSHGDRFVQCPHDCELLDKNVRECNEVLKRKALESIAKSLDRLHNSQIKHDVRGD